MCPVALSARRHTMSKESVQQAALRLARDLAGGISFLARHLGLPANDLDAMMHGREKTPTWVFLRAVDFINEVQQYERPGFPASGWRDDLAGDDKPKH